MNAKQKAKKMQKENVETYSELSSNTKVGQLGLSIDSEENISLTKIQEEIKVHALCPNARELQTPRHPDTRDGDGATDLADSS